MLIRLNLLCSRLEMTIRPPPGGPIEPNRNIDCGGEGRSSQGTNSGGLKSFLAHPDLFGGLLEAVVPEAIVNPLPD